MFTGNEQKIIKDIDAMSIDETRKAIAKGQFGSIGRPDREFAIKYLASKESSAKDEREAESLSISRKALQHSEEANRIAEDANSLSTRANRIALQALSKAKAANIWAAIATLIAAIAMYIAYVEYIKNP